MTTTTDNYRHLAPTSRMDVARALTDAPNSVDAKILRHAPYANKLISLQTAMVPPKIDGTSERVAEIVKGLAKQGAIYPDQMGAIHSDLLNRAYTWNSVGVQESIQALVNDVIHGQNRSIQEEMARTVEIANASVLTKFFESIYSTVERGQRNFESFKNMLRLFINNVPSSEIYYSGTSYNLQINIGGSSQNINLTNAFENLKNIWGAKWDSVNNPRIGALMTPNTRALLFFVSAFYTPGVYEPGSYIDNIMRLYKETIRSDVDAEGDAIMELGEAGVQLNRSFENYKDTLNYLLQNRQYIPPSGQAELSDDQLNVLRYLMRQLRNALRDGIPADISISTMAQYLDPRLFQSNKVFIERLQDYLLMAHMKNPAFYKAIVTDPEWIPPMGIFTGEFIIPEKHEFYFDEDEISIPPSRDEYYDDSPFIPPHQGMSESQVNKLRDEIDDLQNIFDKELGVQSEAGWLTDHRLPGIFDGALNLGPPSVTTGSMSSRSSVSSLADALSRADFRGYGYPSNTFSSLRPSIGTSRRSSMPYPLTTLAKHYPSVKGSGLTRKVLCDNGLKKGSKLRFY
uniref:Hexon-associated protein IIIa n=1 Tax=Pacific black duck aviadenovirus TaxID=2798287 RepID=A0A7T4S049_9ADEN|nr:hexon-associated protein IIIa [Pacific black duck aviadenovirus]